MNAAVANKSAVTPRRYDLDWLRIIVVFLLVPFHTALIFSLDPNSIVYIKDYVESPALIKFAGFLNLWFMPFLFVVAGASSWYALAHRSAGQYMKERVSRLLIPFLFGVTILIPLMTYIHFLRIPGSPSFWSFYPGFFRIDPADLSGVNGTFTPAHLWFILYLFIFSLLALPLFIWLRRPSARPVVSTLGSFFQRRGALLILVVPIALTAAINLLGDKNPVNYLFIFFLGYLLASDERTLTAINRDWIGYGILALAGSIIYLWPTRVAYPEWSAGWLAYGILFNVCRWAWIIAILGAGHRWLNHGSRSLSYLSESAFPFYILHLPVDTLIGFWIIRLQVSIAVKYTLIVALTTIATLAIFELIVRRTGVTRFLFGVKIRKTAPQGLIAAKGPVG